MAINTFPPVAAGGGGLQLYEKIFYSSDTWTKPEGCKTVEVTLLGGGGGAAAYGGGAGGFFRGVIDVSSETEIPITIGAGGASSAGSFGFLGGSTSFGSLATAFGGKGGETSSGGDAGGFINFTELDPRAETLTNNSITVTAQGTTSSNVVGYSNNWFAVNGQTIIATQAVAGGITNYFRSTDGGRNWTVQNSPSTNGQAYLFWHPGQSQFYWISNAIYKSPTGATGSWTYQTTLSGVNLASGIVFDGTYFWGRWSGDTRFLARSTGGATYSQVGTQAPASLNTIRYSNGFIFGPDPNGNNGYSFSASQDGGTTWITVNANSIHVIDTVYLPGLDRYAFASKWSQPYVDLYSFNGTSFNFTNRLASGSWTMRMAANPSNPNQIIYNNYNFLYYSTDGGSTFNEFTGADFYFDSSSFNYALGFVDGVGISVTTNTGNWAIKINEILPPAVSGNPASENLWSGTSGQYFAGSSLATPRADFHGSNGTLAFQHENNAVDVHPVLRFSGLGGFIYQTSSPGSTGSPWQTGGLGLATSKMIARIKVGYGNGGSRDESPATRFAGTSGIAILRYMA